MAGAEAHHAQKETPIVLDYLQPVTVQLGSVLHAEDCARNVTRPGTGIKEDFANAELVVRRLSVSGGGLISELLCSQADPRWN